MNEHKSNILSFALVLSLGLIIASLIIGSTWRKVSKSNVTITVTGSASKEIRSDLAVWRGNFSNESSALTDAYSKLQSSNSKVKNYLLSKGFPGDKIIFSSISTNTLYARDKEGNPTNQITGYKLSQDVSIESNDVDKSTCSRVKQQN
jgi:uncharacterized protein